MLESKDHEYNAAERLIRYASTEQGQSGPQIEASYRHDPFGRRIAKTVKQGSQTKTTYYIYSEQGLMAEADEKGQMIKAYGFNPTTMQLGLWSTDPIWQAETPNGSLTDPKARYDWLHTDHLGTPILATTKEGQTSWKAIAESFGSTQIIEQDIEVNLRFPGQYYDQETQTHYNFHRDYRPNAGRYLQADPIGLGGGINIYIYAKDNPASRIDDKGLKARMCCREIPFLSWIGAHHCFIEIASNDGGDGNCPSCPPPIMTGSISLHGPGMMGSGDYNRLGGQIFRGGLGNLRDFDDPKESTCGAWNNDCDVDECVYFLSLMYPEDSRYGIWRSNSNTFAYHLANSCGITDIPNTWNPGGGDPPAKPAFPMPESGGA